jgi:exodeoxyribonuclease III
MNRPGGLSLLTFNIGNPSAERAGRQLDWLARRDEHVLVLTETKASAGCRLLADAFTAAGYAVIYPRPDPGEYGVMIVSRVTATADGFGDRVGYLPARAAAAVLPAPTGPVRVIGLYVPSRDASPGKTDRKKKWLAACQAALADTDAPATILLGDLNILEPDHQPRYPFFAPFEYDFYRALSGDHGLTDAFRALHPTTTEHSWVGRTGDGYRYDHAFCSTRLPGQITGCEYLHQPRHDRLSDHSALTLHLTTAPPATLTTTNPADVRAPDTLF